MEFRFEDGSFAIFSYSFEPIDSRMYVVLKGKQALIVDPFISEEAKALLAEQEVEKAVILPTHEHYDHISGINWLRELAECTVIASKVCAAGLMDANVNMSNFYEVLFMSKPEAVLQKARETVQKGYVCEADEVFEESLAFDWNDMKVMIRETPGHSKGSVCIQLEDNILFTGDSVVNGAKIITRLPGGSKKDYAERTLPYLLQLPPDTLVLPGHGEAAVLSEFHL